jgi:hypothetical protein
MPDPRIALWLLRAPQLWHTFAMLAARHPPIMTLIRGAPWEDVQ